MTSTTADPATSHTGPPGTVRWQATRDVPVAAPVDLVDATLAAMRGRG